MVPKSSSPVLRARDSVVVEVTLPGVFFSGGSGILRWSSDDPGAVAMIGDDKNRVLEDDLRASNLGRIAVAARDMSEAVAAGDRMRWSKRVRGAWVRPGNDLWLYWYSSSPDRFWLEDDLAHGSLVLFRSNKIETFADAIEMLDLDIKSRTGGRKLRSRK